jgi:hypothetical protein
LSITKRAIKRREKKAGADGGKTRLVPRKWGQRRRPCRGCRRDDKRCPARRRKATIL